MSTPLVNPSAKVSTRSGRYLHVALDVVMSLMLFSLAVAGQSQTPGESPKATKDRLNSQHWWPTKGTPSSSAYAVRGFVANVIPK
jgi:hypothetical protein